MYEKILIVFLIANIPILIFFEKIIIQINIFDKADNVRKLHKNNVALFGGVILFYNLFIFILLDFYFKIELLNIHFNTRELFSLILGINLFFLIGLFDDKFNLSPNKKLFLNFFVILFLILLDENLVVRELNFSFFNVPIELRNFSYMFTILCILLLINALNMFDGINLQVGSYCIIIFGIFIFKNLFTSLSIILILSILLYLYFNFKNKSFLGDSGTQILAFLISYILIKSYNYENAFRPEEIFVILSIPGLDMFRLFLSRLIKGKNPFQPDRNHIHHILLNKLKYNLTFFTIQILIIFNIVFYYLIYTKIIALILTFTSYILLLILFTKNRNKI